MFRIQTLNREDNFRSFYSGDIDNLIKSHCRDFYSAGKGFPSPAI